MRRIAVRVATPTMLGEELPVRVYDVGERVQAFEADCADATDITHGRIELRGIRSKPRWSPRRRRRH